MGKSYKKAVGKYAPEGNWGKKEANRKVRRTKNIPDGKAYRKIFCSYDIHDDVWDGRYSELDDMRWEFDTGNYVRPEKWISEKPNSKRINGCWYINK